MIEFKLDTSDLDALHRKLTPDLYLPAARDLLDDASKIAVQETRDNARRDVGAIAGTIHAVSVSPLQTAVRSRHPGAVAAEFGRRPGTPPPPLASLRSWAARHGMAGREFVLARAISRRGIKGRFFLRRARQQLERVDLPRLVKVAAAAIGRKWGS